MSIPKNLSQPPRPLSEAEIHDRLYGSIAGKKKNPVPPPVKPELSSPAVPSVRAASPVLSEGTWSGAEILSGELKQLRSELISLREEKERLEKKIQKIEVSRQTVSKTETIRASVGPLHSVETIRASSSPARSSGGQQQGWLSHLFGLTLLLLATAYLFGVQKLQASPSFAGSDPTPYTVQVAVYDVRNRADQTLVYLKDLGYEPFLVDSRRQDGRSRYRVYVGSFVTSDEADRERMRLEGDPRFQDFKDAFVRLQ